MMGGACRTYEREDISVRILVGKPEGKRPLRRPGRKWEYKIKMYLQKVGWGNGLD